MGLADDIINGKYSTKYRKKKDKEDLADQIINGTFNSKVYVKEKLEDIAPVATQEDIAPVKEKDERKWFEKGLFEDGYQFGDITKTITSSATDLTEDITKGILGIGEGLIDTGAFLVGGAAGAFGNDNLKNKMSKFIEKDLVESSGIASQIANNSPTGIMNSVLHGKDTTGLLSSPKGAIEDPVNFALGLKQKQADSSVFEGSSVLGEKTDSLVQSGGQLLGTVGLQAVGVPWWLTTGVTSFGSGTEQAFNEGATYGQAGAYGLVTAGAEILTEKLSGGISFGGKTLDEGMKQALGEEISNRTLKTLAKFGFDAFGEGTEEVFSQAIQNVGSLIYDDEKTFWEVVANPEALEGYLENFIGGSVLGGVGSASQSIAKNQSQAQIQGLQQEIAKKTEEYNNSQDAREKQIIQETINGLNEELNELTNAQQITDESELRKQRFTTKETEVSDNQDVNDFYKSIEEAKVNDTKKTHDFTSFVSNIMKDKGIKARAVNHDILIKEGKIYQDEDGQYKFIKNGVKTDQVANINAFKENGILNINMDSSSSKVVEAIVGHEIGEFIKASDEAAYNEIKQIAIELGKADGTYSDETLNRYGDTYQDLTDDVTDEYVNDKLGELFTNENFVNELSKKPNLLQRIINEVKHLVKMATAGSAEARQLLSLQHKLEKKFKEVYRNTDLTQQTGTDTKYSVSKVKTDNQGRTLTKEQQEYFKDSKVRDENGNLLTMYHATDSDFTVFDKGKIGSGSGSSFGKGFYFATYEDLTSGYGEKIGKYYLNIKNPFDYYSTDKKYIVDMLEKSGYDYDKDFVNSYDFDYLYDDDFMEDFLSEALKGKNPYSELSKMLQNAGFDGIEAGSEIVAFEPNQIKNVDNTNPTTNPDIRYSLDTDGKMVDNKGNEVKFEASETGTHGTLMAIHNLTADKLKGVIELGGFPVPSIAITNQPHLNFGDISIIFNKNTIDPSISENKVYSRDGYTTRIPKTVNKIDEKGLKQVAKDTGIEEWSLRERFKETSIEAAIDNLRTNEKVLDKYLEEKEIQVNPIYRDFKGLTSLSQKSLQEFIDKHKELTDIGYTDKYSYSTYEKYYNDVHDLFINELIEEANGKVTKKQAEALYKDYPRYNHWDYFIRDLKSVQELKGKQQLDDYATKNAKEKAVNIDSKEYMDYVKNLISPMFGNKYVRNNKDYYTASGNPRSFEQRYEAYNLENIVKIMNENKGTGQEGGFSTGIGELAADASKRFKSIEDIKNNENLLDTRNTEEYKALLDKYSHEMRDIEKEIMSKYNDSSIDGYIWRERAIEGAMKSVARKIADGKKITIDKVISEFSKNYIEINKNQAQRTIDLINNISTLPTQYFEAKPQRAVGLDEVQTIVAPNDMDADLKQQLRDRGINVIEYDPNIEGDRQAKINEFDELKFSLSAENEIAPTGQWGTHFEDMRLQVEEAIAPLQETINTLSEQLDTVVNSIEQLQAPTSQDIVEKQGQEAFNAITDEQAPKVDVNNMSWEDAIDSIMDSGDFEYSSTEHIPSPLDSRDIDEVGNRKVKAYQYENPEVKPFFQAEAQMMLYDLDNTIKGEKGAIRDELGSLEYYGITRQTTEAIAYLKDNYGYSYEQIRQGLNKIIEDDGKENNAVSKRIEFMLDERLREGYTTSDGYPIPPNEDYINFLNEKQVTEYNKEAFNALTDADVPLEQATMNVEPELKVNKQVIPQEEKTVQNGNTDVAKAKERSWPKTSTESEVVNREILPDDLDYNAVYYQPITNKETLNTANVRLNNLGYEDSVNYFKNKILDKKTTVEDIVLGERLIQEAIKKGDTKTAADIIQDVAILGTELGQKVQALSIIQRMTPEGQLKMLEKTINRGKVKGDKAFTDIELTQKMKDKILKTYNEDGSYNQDKLNEVMDEVKQEIADQMQVTAMDKINAWRYLSMLGNPKTHIRNLVSNVAMQGTLKVKNALARTIETIAPIENRTKTWKAASDEVTNFAKQTALEMKDVISGDSKYSESTDIKAKRQIFKNKVIEKLANLNSDMLEKEDWWFSKGAFESSFREFLTANGISTQADIQKNPELIEKGKNYAVEQAQIATFRQYSWLANKIRDIENKNAATQIAVGAVLPFKKTPINIAKAGLNYSPLGFAKTLTYDRAQVKKGNMEASTLIDHIAQNTTGSALTLVGYMLAKAGFLNGAGDDDKEGKYDYQLGKQAYSINIGGNTYSLSWLSPVAMPLFVGTNMYEQLVEGKNWDANVVIETLGQTLDPLSEMSFLSSLTDTLSSYESGGIQKVWGMLEAAGKNYATQFIPTASSQLASTLDDTKRTTKVSGDSTFKVGEELYNQIIYKIPFLRETLEPSTDIWGNEIKQSENLFTRAFENFIAPYSRKESIATEIDEELKDLYSQTGDNGLLPSIPYNYVNYDGEKYNMSAEEYTDYKKAYGQTANDLLEDLFRTTTYKNATSEERADMVNDVYDYARDEAKLDYLGKEGVDYTNSTKEGEEYYKVNDIKGAIDNDMTVDEYRLYSEKPEKYNFFKNNGISYKDYDSNKELYNYAYEHQDKYAASKAITGDFETYYSHIETMGDFDAKDEYGNSVNGLKKERVYNYIESLDLDDMQKAMMFKMQYPKDDDYVGNGYNDAIVQYVSGLDMTYEEMVQVIEGLGMTVDDEGNVYWE